MSTGKLRIVEPHPAVDYLQRTFWEGDNIFFFLVHSWKKHADKKGNLVADVRTYPLMSLSQATKLETIAKLEREESDGWNVYVSMNPFPEGTTSRTESLITTIRNVFIETDGNGDVLTAIRSAIDEDTIPAPHSILQSSPGKYHIVWRVQEILPEEAKSLNRALASRFDGDPACVDLHRVLRMPGFRNLKYADKPLCQLVEEMNCDGPYAREQFKIETVALKAGEAPITDAALAAVILRAEQNAEEANFELGGRVEDFNGYRWDITCPWAEGHTVGGKSAIVMVLKDGRLEFSCLHRHCAHRGWSDIRKLWEERAGHRLKFTATEEQERFRVVNGELCSVHYELKGRGEKRDWVESTEPLVNFDARIIKHIILDDGLTTTTAHVVSGTLRNGKPLPEVRVLAREFPTMNWVSDSWTVHRASLRPGMGVKDKLRAAIEFFSDEATIERIFVHTGWVKLETGWAFLHAGGAVNGVAQVDLGAPCLERYRLPDPTDTRVDVATAMRTSLALLNVAPDQITVPLWAAMFRAPLASHSPLNFTIWPDAPTGNLKTTLATLFLSHFGEFDVNHSPANWSSTANALEHLAFLLQDMPLLIDEYVPTSVRDVRELEAKAARIIRSQGNLTGRGRMDSNLKQRQSFSPRGLLISTGEGRPPGESLTARCIVLEPRRNTVNLEKLTEAQSRANVLPYAMRGYLSWLAPKLDKLRPELLKMQREGRSKVFRDTSHLCVPETVASVGVGAELALQYAVECKAIDEKKANVLRERIDEALVGTVIDHADRVREENPARRFLRVLISLLDSGQVLMWHKDSDVFPPMDVIGWYDHEYLYLLPETAHKTVAEFCQRQGDPFNTRERIVREQFAEMRVLEKGESQFTRVVVLGGKARRVLQLWRNQAEALLDGGTFPNDDPKMMQREEKKKK
jgi:hypothetical protein